MSDIDEIRNSLDVRIEQLEGEIALLTAAREALKSERIGTSGVADETRSSGNRRRAIIGTAPGSEVVPREVRLAYQRWDERGRPAQAAVWWQRERWLAAIPDYGSLLSELPDELDRSYVRGMLVGMPTTAVGMVEAMVIVYAWGWSTTPVGPPRAQKALAAGVERLGSALVAAREAMLTDGPLAGYVALARSHRVPGLGPSFATKFLYFVSPDGRRALIFDELVASWLARKAALTLSPTRWSPATYDTYMNLMHAWSSRLDIANHQLEEIVFTEEAMRRRLSVWAPAGRRPVTHLSR